MTCRLNDRRSIKRNLKSLVSSLIFHHAAVTNPFEMNSSVMTSLDETFLSPSMFDVFFDLFQSFLPMESFPWMDEFQSIPMGFFPSVDELQSFRRLEDTTTFDAPLSTASIRNSFDPEEGLPIDQLDGNLEAMNDTLMVLAACLLCFGLYLWLLTSNRPLLLLECEGCG